MTQAADRRARDIGTLPLFARLDVESLRLLAERARHERYDAGEMIFTRGTESDCCYGVVDGSVQLVVSSAAGQQKTVEIIRPGQTFGEAVMFLRRPFPVDAVTAQDCEVIRVPASAVDEVIDQRPGAARAMLASLSVRLHTLVRDVEMYTVHPARDRVIDHILGELGDSAAGTVHFRPSKRMIASRLGITPETFSRVLADLTRQGLIDHDGAAVDVLSARALAAARS